MAALHVSGVAAMVWTANNNLTGAEVKEIICSTANYLVNLGEAGSEYHKTEYKLVDAYSAVKKALNINEETNVVQEPENGGILCWVVNKNNEDEKIEGAVVIAENVDTGERESTITDTNGHFELILPEGIYILTVTADGYKEYTSKEIEVKNEGVNYLDDWIKLEKTGLSEESLKALVAENGTVSVWEYHDYDGDGNNEAYAIITTPSYYASDNEIKGIYFIDAQGNLQLLDDTLNGFLYLNSEGQYRKCEGKGFFWADMGAGGSGWSTILYSVKDGKPYELNISGNLQGFYYDNTKKIFYTTVNDFSNGFHEYPEYKLDYNMTTQQFTLGDRVEEDDEGFNTDASGTDAVSFLDQIPIIDSDRYTGNEGDSFVHPIGKHMYSRGNVCTDGVSYEHGIEGWIARWNSIDEKSWAYSTFNLDGKYHSITGECKLIKSYNTDDFNTDLEFWDGNTLIKSYNLTPETLPIDINLDVSGCKELKVYFHDVEAKSGGTSFGLVEMKIE